MVNVIPVTGEYASYVFAAGLGPAAIVWLVALIVFIARIIYVCYAIKYKPLTSESVDDNPKGNSIRSRLFDKTAFMVVLYLFCGSLTYLGLLLCIFDFLPIEAAIPILLLFTWVWWVVLLPKPDIPYKSVPFSQSKSKWLASKFLAVVHKIRCRPFAFLAGIIISTIIIVLTCVIGEGICFPDEYSQVSTRYTRSQTPSLCNSGTLPCHTYLTYSEDPSTSMIVNFHTPLETKNLVPVVYFDTISHTELDNYTSKAVGKTFIYDTRDVKRAINWVYLENLIPDTVYFFRVGMGIDLAKDAANFGPEKKFKTVPLGDGGYSFITGGDPGVTESAFEMSAVAGNLDPLFGVVGGDIPYGNGFYTCYREWDTWLSDWETHLVTADKIEVPMILALGNHEAGGFHQPISNIPYYMTWFPQSEEEARSGDVSIRKTFHAHRISNNSVMFALDSLISDQSGEQQTVWLRDQMSNVYRDVPNKGAVYHVPLYPSFRDFENADSAELRATWLPIFDEFHLTVGYENHDHSYKRSKILKNNQEDPTGTLYIGDGAWGVTPRQKTPEQLAALPFYLEKYEEKNFVFNVIVGANVLNITAVDITGAVFDTFTRPF